MGPRRETRPEDRLKTHFDFDYYFGTVTHRFCAQAVAGYPVTVYGKDEQRKPFVSHEDAVEGLARLALEDPEGRPDDPMVYNQVTRAISIVEVANTIADVGREFDLDVDVEHFENPHDEDETHKMEIEYDRYDDLVDGQSQTFESGIRDIFEKFVDRKDRIEAHEDRFLAEEVRRALDRDLEIVYMEDEHPGPSYHVSFDRLAETGFDLEWTLEEGIVDLEARLTDSTTPHKTFSDHPVGGVIHD